MLKNINLIFLNKTIRSGWKIAILIMMTIPTGATAQNRQSKTYVSIQAGVPLFWGDLYSLGDRIRLGKGMGFAFGHPVSPWLDIEIGADYGVAKLGPGNWQLEDYIDQQGLIRYTQGIAKLGDLYSRTSFGRIGIRTPVKLLKAMNTKRERHFDIELSPHFYINHFRPELITLANGTKLLGGAKPGHPTYSYGGDLAASLKLARGTSIYLRSALSYLDDERFEGISSKPVWNINLQLYTTIGIKMVLNQKQL